MLTDNDKCPTCGGSITWGTDADTVSYCGHIKPIWYSYIMCENPNCFHLSNWVTVTLDTFTGTRRSLENELEKEYRAIVERSEYAKRHTAELFEKIYKRGYHG